MELKDAQELARVVPLVEGTGEAKARKWKEKTTMCDKAESRRGEGPVAGPERGGSIRAAPGLVCFKWVLGAPGELSC